MRLIGIGRVTRIMACGLLLWLSEASACPLCHTDTGRQVRAGILDRTFGSKLLLTAAPFPVFAGIIGLIYFECPAFYKRKLESNEGPKA